MAKGRMINNKITKNKKVHLLSDDTSRLAFTWLITFTDRDGRTYGDPAIVRSMIFPRREDISIAQMAAYIQEWHDRELIVWYEVDGDWYIYFPGFEGEQEGLRYDREAASIIPAPPESYFIAGSTVHLYGEGGEPAPQIPIDDSIDGAELVRSNAGVSPAEVKLKEVNKKEVKGKETAAPASFFTFHDAEKLYRDITGQITIPPRSSNGDGSNDYLESLLAIASSYTDPGKLITDGKAQFSKWCNTRGKNGAYYKRTNPGWVAWWLSNLAPRPEAPPPVTIDAPAALCGQGAELRKQAEQDPEYYGKLFHEHIKSCDFCGGKVISNMPMPDNVRADLRKILNKKAVKDGKQNC